MLPSIPVEAPAEVAGHAVLLGVGLGHLETTEAGKRICIDLAAAPYARRLYVWMRDVRRLEVEDAAELAADEGAPLAH